LICAFSFNDLVYEIPSGHLLGEFNGHFNIVYSLCWSNDDKTILSASSDGTVRVWNTENYQSPAEKILPHPSFIYTAKYHPFVQCLVVTGGYDSIIRVWNINVNEVNGQLLQELDGHKSFINTLCFDAEGLRMFSGDSTGLVIVWSTVVNQSSPENLVQQWTIAENIMQNDLKGVPINHLEVHPNGRRLLIHARDSTLRVMDLRVLAAKKYTGATNYREQLYSTFTPCGMFLFSGSEDGICYVWNSETDFQHSQSCFSTISIQVLKMIAFRKQFLFYGNILRMEDSVGLPIQFELILCIRDLVYNIFNAYMSNNFSTVHFVFTKLEFFNNMDSGRIFQKALENALGEEL
ncbi:jouberin, partial [Rhincodon typus]|uniref:jouberin n=1 Tax=Rhincodon typus TaxID=259920 RepID=UPI00202EC6E7